MQVGWSDNHAAELTPVELIVQSWGGRGRGSLSLLAISVLPSVALISDREGEGNGMDAHMNWKGFFFLFLLPIPAWELCGWMWAMVGVQDGR